MTGVTRTERACLGTAAMMAVLLMPTSLAVLWDGRTLYEQSVWAKPLKFQASLALHLATVALAARALAPGMRRGWQVQGLLGVATALAVAELAYIMVQAARQQPSHFNVSTPFHATMYALMGIGAVLLVVCAAVQGALVAMAPAKDLPPALRWGLVLGLVTGAALTVAVAGQIGARMSPFVGPDAAAGPRLWGTGWALTGGDLRIAHFFATHTMQALPLAGFVFGLVLSPGMAVIGLMLLACSWTAGTIWLFVRALGALPPWPV